MELIFEINITLFLILEFLFPYFIILNKNKSDLISTYLACMIFLSEI